MRHSAVKDIQHDVIHKNISRKIKKFNHGHVCQSLWPPLFFDKRLLKITTKTT